MEQLHQRFADQDGFLYMEIRRENTFWSPQLLLHTNMAYETVYKYNLYSNSEYKLIKFSIEYAMFLGLTIKYYWPFDVFWIKFE